MIFPEIGINKHHFKCLYCEYKWSIINSMKWITFSIAILFFNITSFAQGHFIVAWSGFGDNRMNINVIGAQIDGIALNTGDEIAAFDGTICCGKIILQRPITSSDINTIIVSQKEPGLANGYTLGNPITYKFWNSSSNIEFSGIIAEYLDPVTGSNITPPLYNPENSSFVVNLSVVNHTPTSNAGVDQTANEGIVVTLDGSASSDPDNNPLTYSWTAPNGITLSSTTVAKPTFTTPEVSANTNYTFSLIVNDGKINSASDQVVINVQDCTPTAPTVGTITQPTCALATGSVVLNGLPASGTWTLTKSPGGATTTGSGTSSTISALAEGTYTFTVTNASGCISPASANVVINAQPATPTAPTVGTITQPTCAVATGSVVLNGLPCNRNLDFNKVALVEPPPRAPEASSTISALAAGTYTFTVTNASGMYFTSFGQCGCQHPTNYPYSPNCRNNHATNLCFGDRKCRFKWIASIWYMDFNKVTGWNHHHWHRN